MTINYKNKTIELTKTEMKNASLFGSEGYKALREARDQNPGYKVIVAKTKKSTADFANLNKATIKRYVYAHGNTQQQEDYETLTAEKVDAETGEKIPSVSFFVLKKWFLKEFEADINEGKAIREKRKMILEKEKDTSKSATETTEEDPVEDTVGNDIERATKEAA